MRTRPRTVVWRNVFGSPRSGTTLTCHAKISSASICTEASIAVPAATGTGSAIGKKSWRRRIRCGSCGAFVIDAFADSDAANHPPRPSRTPSRDTRVSIVTCSGSVRLDHEIDGGAARRRTEQLPGIEPHAITRVLGDLRRRRAVEPGDTAAPESLSSAAARMLDRRQEELEGSRHERAARLQELLARLAGDIENPRVDAEAANLIADDDVGALRQVHEPGMIANDRDAVAESVGVGDAARQAGNRSLLDRVDARGAGPGREQAEDAGAGGDVGDDGARLDHVVERAGVGGETMTVAKVRAVLVEVREHVRPGGTPAQARRRRPATPSSRAPPPRPIRRGPAIPPTHARAGPRRIDSRR